MISSELKDNYVRIERSKDSGNVSFYLCCQSTNRLEGLIHNNVLMMSKSIELI